MILAYSYPQSPSGTRGLPNSPFGLRQSAGLILVPGDPFGKIKGKGQNLKSKIFKNLDIVL
jgi:hypothetical protein